MTATASPTAPESAATPGSPSVAMKPTPNVDRIPIQELGDIIEKSKRLTFRVACKRGKGAIGTQRKMNERGKKGEQLGLIFFYSIFIVFSRGLERASHVDTKAIGGPTAKKF